MKTILKLSEDLFDDLMEHLLPSTNTREQAAFLFARDTRTQQQLSLEVVETKKILDHEFESQLDDFLELSDATRAGLIKTAHDLRASLIELHSHPGPGPAAFSHADLLGLRETVPHMWWRLAKRPYVALVVSRSGFDALVWVDGPHVPQGLDCLVAGHRLLHATDNSLRRWQ